MPVQTIRTVTITSLKQGCKNGLHQLVRELKYLELDIDLKRVGIIEFHYESGADFWRF